MKQSPFTSLGLLFLIGSHPTNQSSAQSFDWVAVGHAGNGADPITGFGSVPYSYRISTHEITNAQYANFLNSVGAGDPGGFNTGNLYNDWMGIHGTVLGITRSGSPGSYSYTPAPGAENNPVAYVNWFDAARYVNWLHNGGGSGDTESGVYDLSLSGFAMLTRSPDAHFWIPDIDEWYKAAYYDPTKDGAGGYWTYPTGSDAAPGYSSFTDPNNANYAPGTTGGSDPRVTPVGSFVNSGSYYGTFDQGGNLFEWVTQSTDGGDIFSRGGGWAFGAEFVARTGSQSYVLAPTAGETDHTGFRIVTAIPEPAPALLVLAGLLAASGRRRNRRA